MCNITRKGKMKLFCLLMTVGTIFTVMSVLALALWDRLPIGDRLPVEEFEQVPIFDVNIDAWEVRFDEELGFTYLRNKITGREILQAGRFDQFGNFYLIDLVEYAQKLNITPTSYESMIGFESMFKE